MSGNIKTIGIVSALNTEIRAFKDVISNIEEKRIGRHLFYLGDYENKKIIFTDSGVGKVNAAITSQILINEFKPDFIINTGIAGGLNEKLSHTDLVVANELTYHDFDSRLLEKYSPYIKSFKAEEKYLEIARMVLENKKYFEGLVITGDQFITDSSKKEELINNFNAYCVEMEGAAIAHTAYLNNIPFMVIRCISDLADDDGDDDYDDFEIIAADKASKFTLEFIKKL
ncbi:MAG: 5'-methylthioadenosine/adenosylhomocysteine nucleosidase [Miniphocaeibacter sp.]|uniref:5'-methylthioadenosine/adenosylhomocysteine nucleosidase n=1 Tax=Miniphocaeibacter sp. TaxID=3100973 RepID=UPI003BAF3312